ncbi:MAG: hypothetical protein IKV94_03515 [Clostridia bacterium]|nr:hypothetical protein [Clostridia bacterium]
MYILSKTNEIKRYRYISNSIYPLSIWIKARHSLLITPLFLFVSEFGIRKMREILSKGDKLCL